MEQAASELMWQFNDYWSVTPNKEHLLLHDLLHSFTQPSNTTPPSSSFLAPFLIQLGSPESWLGHCPLLICYIMSSLKAQENEVHQRSKAKGLSRLAPGLLML